MLGSGRDGDQGFSGLAVGGRIMAGRIAAGRITGRIVAAGLPARVVASFPVGHGRRPIIAHGSL